MKNSTPRTLPDGVSFDDVVNKKTQLRKHSKRAISDRKKRNKAHQANYGHSVGGCVRSVRDDKGNVISYRVRDRKH